MATEKIKAVVKRLSTQPNQYGSYAYALIRTDKKKMPKNLRLYGKEGEYANSIFYINKLVGDHEKEIEVNIAYVERTSTSTGEVTSQIIILRSEKEVRDYEMAQRKAQEASKQARLFGISKQQIGAMAMDRILDGIYGKQSPSTREPVVNEDESDDEVQANSN